MNNYPQDEYFNKECLNTAENSRLAAEKDFIQHGSTSCLMHSIAVAYFSYKAAKKLRFIRFSYGELIRGALLHDYFLYDWHIADKSHRLHGFFHAAKALANARRDFRLTEREQDIIAKHMFPMTLYPPKFRESALICIVDKLCSLYEVFAVYKNRSVVNSYNIIISRSGGNGK